MPLYRYSKPPPPELGDKSLWQYLPRQSTRRVLFLLLALGAVIFLKRSGGWSLGGLLDASPVGDPAAAGAPTYHLRVTQPPAPKSAP
jgi:hypothetical protein